MDIYNTGSTTNHTYLLTTYIKLETRSKVIDLDTHGRILLLLVAHL
jgi:hypothetical protein